MHDKTKPPLMSTLAVNSPINVPWKYWSKKFGGGFISWLHWLTIDDSPTLIYMYEEYLHDKAVANQECHIWLGQEWCYCGSS